MRNLIIRNTPGIADCFELRDIPSADGKNTYEVFCENGKIIVCGDCKISQAMGYYDYLKKYCGVNRSHCGNTELDVAEAPLFEGKLSKVIPQQRRVYLNYCTFGYSMAFWKWDKWEKEIDFMAMNGINMPLAVVGTEAVWYYTLRDMGYSENGALRELSGPAFWPWQMMNNIEGYFSLTDVNFIESRAELGKKIIDRELELGMTPIQQGFAGMVPKSIKKSPKADFGKARMSMVQSWCNFPVTFIVDPTDPAFKRFGRALLENQKKLFGAYHYYACDPFHENEPTVKTRDYLFKVGRAIDSMYKEFDPESVWVMQSWSLREQIVKAVPKERLLILDINGAKHSENEEFWGYDFVLGNIHSFGDRNTLHGSVKLLAENAYSKLNAPNCVGTGLFPEGIFQNPLYYDLQYKMLTEADEINLDVWLADYARRRYGTDAAWAVNAVKKLRESCYSDACTGRETGSPIALRPTTKFTHAAPNDHPELRYDNAVLLEAAQSLLSAEDCDSDGWLFDVCDVTRQVLSNYAGVLYSRAMKGFEERDLALFERSANGFMKICEEIDDLLQTRPELSLYTHLEEAGALALSEKEKENFELNLLTQVTLWGPINNPSLYDYAWKEWGGLIKTYYAKRWQSFFERLALEFPHKHSKFSTVTKKQRDARNTYLGNPFYKSYAQFETNWLRTCDPEPPTDGDTVALAKRLIEKYAEKIKNQ